jgi:hypothetical protein
MNEQEQREQLCRDLTKRFPYTSGFAGQLADFILAREKGLRKELNWTSTTLKNRDKHIVEQNAEWVKLKTQIDTLTQQLSGAREALSIVYENLIVKDGTLMTHFVKEEVELICKTHKALLSLTAPPRA